MTDRLEAAVRNGERLGKKALYFGAWSPRRLGHFLYEPNGMTARREDYPDLYWSDALMDGGLLTNGRVPDKPDGRVFYTVGGAEALWYAFYWWDRSGDSRGNSNSGFYVRGFGWPAYSFAFDYACTQFPSIVARQPYPLVVQLKEGQ